MALDAVDKRGMVFSLLGFSLFSIGDVFLKSIADSGFTPSEIAFFLNLFYLPFLLVLSPTIGGIRAALRTEKLWLHVLRAMVGVVVFIINVTAFKILGLSLSYCLIFLGPFCGTLLAHFFTSDKIKSHRLKAVLLGFAGIVLVLQPWSSPLHPIAYLMIVGAFLSGMLMVTARKIGGDEPLLAFSLFGTIIGLQVYGVLSFWDGQANIPNGTQWFSFLAVATMHTGGMLLTARAYAIADSSLVAPFQYVQLLWGTAFGYFLFSNMPGFWTLFGTLVIVFSGIYMIYRERVCKQNITTGVTSHGGIGQE